MKFVWLAGPNFGNNAMFMHTLGLIGYLRIWRFLIMWFR